MKQLNFVTGAIFLFASTTYVDARPDLDVTTNFTDEIEIGKQYFIDIKCSIDPDLDGYRLLLNSDGEFIGSRPVFRSRVNEVSHYLIVSDEATFALSDLGQVKYNPGNAPNMVVTFAYEDGENNLFKLADEKLCRREIFLYGKKSQHINSFLVVSSGSAKTKFVSALLALSETLLGSASQIVRYRDISDEATSQFRQANNIVNAYKTFQTAIAHRKEIIEPSQLGVGTMTIKTNASTVVVRVREVPSFLKAGGVPFTTFYGDFLEPLNMPGRPDVALAGERDNLTAEQIEKYQKACLKLSSDMKYSGLVADQDRAFLLGAAIGRYQPDLINVIRCFVAAGLENSAFDEHVRKYVLKKGFLTRLYSKSEIDDYKRKYDKELRLDVLPEIKKSSAEAQNGQKTVLNRLLRYYKLAINEARSGEDVGHGMLQISRSMAPAALLYDTAGVLDMPVIEGGGGQILSTLSDQGFNRLNCYFLRNSDHENRLGEAVFSGAPAVMLMHRVSPDHPRLGKLPLDNAVVLRIYFDEKSQFVSAIETSEEPADAFFEHHSTCKRLKAS